MSRTDELKELYGQYFTDGAEPQRRTVGDLFKGWFSGKGRGNTEADEAFMKNVEACVNEIAAGGNGDEAFAALSVILSQPRGKKFNSRDLVYAAMHSHGVKLVPLLNGGQAGELAKSAEEIPKPYRFPAYKQFVKALNEKAAGADEETETAGTSPE